MSSAPGERVKLALVIHFHQPVGNLDAVVEKATERCYRPFLTLLESSPDVPMTLHLSGCLLEWLEHNASDVADLVEQMVRRGQVELMTGGFYEPILAALPHVDQLGQIQRLTAHLQDRYGARPTGLWLTERVWEQDVVGAISEAAVRYTVVDDTMFHGVGVTDEEMRGSFVTDHEGRTLLVYAGDRNLRYLIPYKKVERVIDYLQASEPGRLHVYADDGEKFGEWPDTYDRVYTKGWLEGFFRSLVEARDSIELIRLGDHAAAEPPVGRVYLPSSSYDEMMTWALPTEARLKVGALRRTLQKDDPDGALPFVQGAPWRSFLAKYPEVNQLQKRMLNVSAEVHRAGADAEALKELYRAQCNCAYWHGSFGGVYLGFMRSALWHHLMKAEALVDRAGGHRVYELDLDADTRSEILLEGPWGVAVASPERGGRLIEFDDWTIGANLLAVMSRHREAYHLTDENPSDGDEEDDDEMAAIQPRTEVDPNALVFDEQTRGALTDHLDGEQVAQPYSAELTDTEATLTTEVGGVLIKKTLAPDDDGLGVTYRLTASAGHSGSFGVEWSVLPLNLGREVAQEKVDLRPDGWSATQPEAEVGIEVSLSPQAEVTAEPLETGSATLEGLQTMHQGTSVCATWELDLAAGEVQELQIHMRPLPNRAALDKADRGVSA